MIELYTSGSYFGLPDPSPFVVKAMMLLKMSGVPFEERPMSFREAPKGKVPYIRDGNVLMGDSHFIGLHLEDKHGIDFSGGYTAEDIAKGWAIARMLEERFYFLLVQDRWVNDANFEKGPRQFFRIAPAPIRPLLARLIRRKVRKMQFAQGIGRHSDAERFALGTGDIDAIATLLANNKYMLGERLCGVDATVFAFLSSAACKLFDSQIANEIRARPVLISYLTRIRDQFFPGTEL